MSHAKYQSKTLDHLHARLGGLQAIDPKLNLGNGISVASLSSVEDDLRASVDLYNQLLAQADAQRIDLRTKEKLANDLAKRSLLAVATKYGDDSAEYSNAGGTPRSLRKRSPRKPKVTPAAVPAKSV